MALRCVVLGSLAIFALLGAGLTRPQDAPEDCAQRKQAIEARYDAALDSYAEASRAATTAAEYDAAERLKPDGRAFSQEYLTLAAACRKTETSLRCCLEVLQLRWDWRFEKGKADSLSDAAVRILLEDHADSPQLVSLAPNLMGDREADAKTMRALAASTPHAEVRVACLMSIARRNMDVLQDAEDDRLRKEARELLAGIVREHAAVKYFSHPAGKTAEQWLHVLEKLRIGLPAPALKGKDLDGVEFALSDYKGKVVLLDFWGHW